MQPAGPSHRVPTAGRRGVPGTAGKQPAGEQSLTATWKHSAEHKVGTGDPHTTKMVPTPGAARVPSAGLPSSPTKEQPPPAPHLHPGVGSTQLSRQLCPRVDDSPDLCQGHEGQRQVRPGVEAHHLAVEETCTAVTTGVSRDPQGLAGCSGTRDRDKTPRMTPPEQVHTE